MGKDTKTAGMSQCADKLRVHPTEQCKGTSCSSSSSVCCQQKCSDGFKVKGGSGTQSKECGQDLSVHKTAYCKGSSCADTDKGVCCQQKCTAGWKKTSDTSGKQSNICTGDDKSVQISSGGYCKGSSCAAGDVDTCCDVLCNDKKKGFKTADDKTGKQPNTCA